MSSTDIEFFLNLESSVWKALVRGDPKADESLLAEDFLGVYSTGFAGRGEHVGQLATCPVAQTYSLSNARVIHLCPDTVVLSYLATWSRHGSESATRRERTYISSIWQHQNGVWQNVFSQDTKADA